MNERREGKSRLVAVTSQEEVRRIQDQGLGGPFLYGGGETPYFCDAEELRAWRATRTSQPEQP